MDKPKGRKLVMTPPEAKVWAEREGIPYIQLKTLRTEDVPALLQSYAPNGFDFFVVASYGKLIPQSILDIPRLGTINVHPSLLPKLRGASPLQSAILSENETGVSIMRLDVDMDHGPIIVQKKLIEWNMDTLPYSEELEEAMGIAGGTMLAEILPEWLAGKVVETEQNHELATLCGKIEKESGLLNLDDSPEINLRKIRAYHAWPGAYFFMKRKDGTDMRIVVKRAHIADGMLVLDRIVPEGKKEMSYADFKNGFKQ
jgi:methionyl-tRNA formyltransferase